MEQNNNAAAEVAQPLDSAKANWAAIMTSTETVQPVKTEPTIDPQTKDTVEEKPLEVEKPIVPEVKPIEAKTEETKPKTEAKEELTLDTLELTPEHIENAPKQYEEGSYQKTAYDLMGVDLAENSLELLQNTFKENYIPKAEVEKITSANREKYFATLNPEVAAALELKDLGVPDEYLLDPTRDIDAYLAMEDSQLVRNALLAQPNWTEDMADVEMEELSADPTRLAHKARIARINLQNDRQSILNTKAQLVQQYTEQKQQAVFQQKVEADNKFKEALTKESAFIGLPISQAAKNVILDKYSKGLYENALSDAESKVRAILQLEFGNQFSKIALSKAKAEGQAEIVRRLADVPPLKGQGGGAVQVQSENTNNWSALKGG